jgi:peptidoglycan/LPS O-acetylase OafA/YrhL
MVRERALKVLLALLGLLFIAGIYPITTTLLHGDESAYGDTMMLSLYFVLGILLLIAVPNPGAHRSLIAFAAWSSFAHAAVMAVMAVRTPSDHELLPGVAVLGVIGGALLVLLPARSGAQRTSAAGA